MDEEEQQLPVYIEQVERTNNYGKIFGWILRLPLILLVLISWGASFYAAYMKIQSITYVVPIIYTVFIVLYILGLYIKRL
jgi:hypothetical protein